MIPFRQRMLEDTQVRNLSPHTARLRRERRPVRPVLWALAGGLGPGGDSHLQVYLIRELDLAPSSLEIAVCLVAGRDLNP
jgi:hypothetical protein